MSKRWGIAAIVFTGVIVVYLLTQVFSGVTNPAEQTYIQYCADCHGVEGEGLGLLIPPLAQADWLRDHQVDLACIIQYGMSDDIVVNGQSYTSDMLGIEGLTSIQIANIINYINSSWGNDYGYMTVAEVEMQMKQCNE